MRCGQILLRGAIARLQSYDLQELGNRLVYLTLFNIGETEVVVSFGKVGIDFQGLLILLDRPSVFLASGAGVGQIAPAAVGAALANRDQGILTAVIQPDGDLMYAPGVLWTAAHHKIPILMLMHNNRAYHQEVMHLQKMAGLHNRRMDTARIGTTIENPDIDYALLARAQGVWAEGPITDPAAIAPALQRAVAVVRKGEPALIDVVTQGR